MILTAPRSCVVIGGGLVGAASALRLQAGGFQVTLIDPGDPRRAASFGNIGHIAAEQCDPLPSPAALRGAGGRLFGFGGPLDFRMADAPLLAPWIARFLEASTPARSRRIGAVLKTLLARPLEAWAELLAIAGAPDIVRPVGHNVVWMEAGRAAAGLTTWRAADTGTAAFRSLEGAELEAYEAVLRSRPAGGLRFTGTGQANEPQAVRDALLADFARRGGETVAAAATRIQADADSARVTLAGGETIEADLVLVAAGAWSGPLMETLGVRAPVIAERGYSVQWVRHAWPADLPLTVFEERSLVVARFTGGLRASSFVEFGRPDAPPDPRKWRHIERGLSQLGVAVSSTPDRWMGPRPTLPDYLPAIGRLERQPRVLYAFGHQHLGLTLAAVTAELIEALATGAPPRMDLKALRIERFRKDTPSGGAWYGGEPQAYSARRPV